jgi:predicted dehydrogenase
MDRPIRWGILGTGNIAKQFARGLSVLPDAQLVAVGSRSVETADAFGDAFDVPRRHASYAALAEDPEVDVIYVSTPHPLHAPNTILCLEAGKPVLCEKPFAINAREAESMIAVARRKNLFLMEAMWTRFLPAVAKAREWVDQGRIGEVRMIAADFGFRAGWDEESRLLNREMGGGALLDVGIYPVSLASFFLRRQPTRISGLADIGATGVDEQAAVVLGYDKGELAVLYTAVRTNTPQDAHILGNEGAIRLDPPFWKGTQATLTIHGQDAETVELPYDGNGYNCEAAEVMRCLREGRLESDVMPLDETLAIMRTLDRIREGWGLRYPADEA